MRKLAFALILVLALGACGGSDESPADAAPSCYDEGPSDARFGRGRALLDSGTESTLIDVQVAGTPEARTRGLMNRTSLGEDCGMAFLFFEESTGGFWMKNTLIPLSIAFFDEEGTIVRILDMEPCKKDPCPTYDPEASYWGALEVNQGAFEEWDISEGDHITITQ